MTSRSHRGKSFHEDSEDASSTSDLMTPQYNPSAVHPIEHMKLSLEDDDDAYPVPVDDDDDDEGEDEDEEQEKLRYSRGRSRSRSIHALDEDPTTGVIHVDPTLLATAAASSSTNEAAKLQEMPIERSGPLPLREVETLKKVCYWMTLSLCVFFSHTPVIVTVFIGNSMLNSFFLTYVFPHHIFFQLENNNNHHPSPTWSHHACLRE